MNKRRIPPETSYQLEVTELVKLFKGIIRSQVLFSVSNSFV